MFTKKTVKKLQRMVISIQFIVKLILFQKNIPLLFRYVLHAILRQSLIKTIIVTSVNPERQKTVQLAKQKKVIDYLSKHFSIESIDSVVDSKCGLERPDIVINPTSGFFKIIVEVDERQHKDRQEICECTRMINISESFQSPCLFIRYNPDEFKSEHSDEISERKRLNRLNKVLGRFIENETIECTVGLVKLFFDGWNDTEPVEIMKIRKNT